MSRAWRVADDRGAGSSGRRGRRGATGREEGEGGGRGAGGEEAQTAASARVLSAATAGLGEAPAAFAGLVVASPAVLPSSPLPPALLCR